MRRFPAVVRVLFAVLPACGRIGFDAVDVPDAGSLALELEVECGVALPAVSTLEVVNDDNESLEVRSATISDGFSLVTALPVSVPAGDTARLDIRPAPAVIGTDRGGSVRAGVLTLDTSRGVLKVKLSATVFGAEIDVVDVASQPLGSLMFAASSGVCPMPQMLVARNTGNRAASVQVLAQSGIALDLFEAPLDPGQGITFSARVVTPMSCTGNGAVGWAGVSGVVCSAPGTAPASFTITGAAMCMCS